MNAAVKAQLLAHGAKLPPDTRIGTATARTPTQRHQDAPAAGASLREAKNAQPESTATASPATCHYIGRYQLQVASGTHYPGRTRAVLTGPTDAGLLQAVLAAVEAYCSTRN